MQPLSAVTMVFRTRGSDVVDFLGSSFAFRWSTHFLTAAHCVGNLSARELQVGVPIASQVLDVVDVIKHPKADIALLITREPAQGLSPFWGAVNPHGLGEEIMAYGYPEDVFGDAGGQPTARLFRGYYQRVFEHKSRLGYSYVAGEMSMGAPGGLSGGPVFRPAAPVMVTGLVTENHESTTVLHSVSEITTDGKEYREKYQQVINYGVALLLAGVSEWIDAHVPARDGADIIRDPQAAAPRTS